MSLAALSPACPTSAAAGGTAAEAAESAPETPAAAAGPAAPAAAERPNAARPTAPAAASPSPRLGSRRALDDAADDQDYDEQRENGGELNRYAAALRPSFGWGAHAIERDV